MADEGADVDQVRAGLDAVAARYSAGRLPRTRIRARRPCVRRNSRLNSPGVHRRDPVDRVGSGRGGTAQHVAAERDRTTPRVSRAARARGVAAFRLPEWCWPRRQRSPSSASLAGLILALLHLISDQILTAATSIAVHHSPQWSTLIYVVVSVGLCLVGALTPAVRAARMNISESIADE